MKHVLPLACHCTLKRQSGRSAFFSARTASLTAGSADLKTPEGKRGKPYYFCLTARPHSKGQSKAQVSALHLRTSASYLQLLCPLMCQMCGGEKSGASQCCMLLLFFSLVFSFFPPFCKVSTASGLFSFKEFLNHLKRSKMLKISLTTRFTQNYAIIH